MGLCQKIHGELILPYAWDNFDAAPFYFGWAIMETYDDVSKTTTFHYVSEEGKVLDLPKGISPFYGTYPFENGLAIIVDDATGLLGYTDTNGNIIIAPKFTDANDFEDETTTAKRDGMWWTIDKAGNLLEAIPNADKNGNPPSSEDEADDWYYMHNDLRWYETDDDTYGLMDRSGRFLFPPVLTMDLYEFYYDEFPEGLQAVGLDGKWGYLDESGAFEIPPIYDRTSNFVDGLGYVRLGERMGYIDHYGHLVYMEPPTKETPSDE